MGGGAFVRVMKFKTYSEYCREVFGHRMQKLTVDAGFSCPNIAKERAEGKLARIMPNAGSVTEGNRDGSKKRGGCTFCNNEAFSPAYCREAGSITQQITEGIAFHRHRHRGACGYLAYMQSFSNTYAPLPVLRERYEEALAHPAVEGLVIGTRPDCVDEEKLDYLAALAKEHYVMVEYGIESCYDRTLERVCRGHDFACTERAIRATAERGIACGGHLILGLPGESREDILAEADIVSRLPLTSIKLHQLQILKGTVMEQEYRKGLVPRAFTLQEYVELVRDFLQRLRSDMVVERFVSEVPPRWQAAPERGWRHDDGTPVRGEEVVALVVAGLE